MTHAWLQNVKCPWSLSSKTCPFCLPLAPLFLPMAACARSPQALLQADAPALVRTAATLLKHKSPKTRVGGWKEGLLCNEGPASTLFGHCTRSKHQPFTVSQLTHSPCPSGMSISCFRCSYKVRPMPCAALLLRAAGCCVPCAACAGGRAA